MWDPKSPKNGGQTMYDFFRGPIAAYERFYLTRTSVDIDKNVPYFLNISPIHV